METMKKLACLALAMAPALCANVPREAVKVTTTDRVELASGGTIRLVGTSGELSVEGSDTREAVITLTRSAYPNNSAKDREQATRSLNAIRVVTNRSADGELVVTTVFQRHLMRRLFRPAEINLDYRVQVPHDSRVVIHHGVGDVVIYDVTGPLEATVKTGDIVVQLPASTQYTIDARCAVGGIHSDFPAGIRSTDLIGQKTGPDTSAPSRRVYLRTGIGGIQIVRNPPEAHAHHVRTGGGRAPGSAQFVC
jgi:hypothetical protein